MAYFPSTPDRVDSSNSSTTPLGSGATFTGTAVDCTTLPISSITVFSHSDVASATNGLELQWSQDNVNWADHIQKDNVAAGESGIISDKVRAHYYRVKYTNGGTGQATFRIQTIQSSTNTSGTVRDLDTKVQDDDEAQLTRSIITGKSSTGIFTDVKTDVYGNLPVNFGTGARDAFGRGRVALPQTLFQVHFQYDINPLTMQTLLTGTGSVIKTSNISSVTLSTGGTLASAGAILQSHGHYRYEPGKSQQISATGVVGAYIQYVRKLIGYVGVNDGVFFDMDGITGGANTAGATGVMAVTVRTSTSGSVVDTQVLQSSWNVDKMDGTGISGITLDFTKTQIFYIDLQWLGSGTIQFGFEVNGVLYYCHQINNANSLSIPYMNKATLPIRWQIYNDPAHAAAGTNTMSGICGSIISEGGSQSPQILIFSADSLRTPVSCSTTALVPVLSISPATTINSISNRAVYRVLGASLMNTANQTGYWALIYNPTITGFSFSALNPYSGMTVDKSATGMILTITGSSFSGSTKIVTGAWTGGANNQYVGQYITLSGFTGGDTANNGSWVCIASSAGSISLTIAGGNNGITGSPVAIGGVTVASGYIQPTGGGAGGTSQLLTVPDLDRLDLPLSLSIDGLTADVYTLAVQGQSGTCTVLGELHWSEDR